MSKATAYWDGVSRIYEKMFQKFEPYEEVYRFIKENLTSEMNVLEVGTATGLVAREIAGRVKTVVATDISEKMIEQAKNIKYPKNVTFSCANIFKNRRFSDCPDIFMEKHYTKRKNPKVLYAAK